MRDRARYLEKFPRGMVLLGTSLLRYVKKPTYLPNPLAAAGLVRGPAAVRDIMPHTIKRVEKPTPRPDEKISNMEYTSILLGVTLRLKVTIRAQRYITYSGGFDRYIFYTPDEKLRSDLARTLKLRMHTLVAKHPILRPPPLDKRRPRPLPKKLPLDIPPMEIAQTSDYKYLG